MSKATGVFLALVLAVAGILGVGALYTLKNPDSYKCNVKYEQAKVHAVAQARLEGRSANDIKSIVAALEQQRLDELKDPNSDLSKCVKPGPATPSPTPTPTPTPSTTPTPTPTPTPTKPVETGPWWHWFTTDPGKTHEFNFGPVVKPEEAVEKFFDAIRKDPSQTCVHYQTKVEAKTELDVTQYNNCVRELIGDQAKAQRMAQEIEKAADYSVEQRHAGRVNTYTMVMVDDVPHVLSYNNAPRPDTYWVLVAKLKNGNAVTTDRLECFFQPEQRIERRKQSTTSNGRTVESADSAPATTYRGDGKNHVAETERHEESGDYAPDTPQHNVAAPPEMPKCVNGGEPDKNGRCEPKSKPDEPEATQPPETTEPTKPVETRTPEKPVETTEPPATREPEKPVTTLAPKDDSGRVDAPAQREPAAAPDSSQGETEVYEGSSQPADPEVRPGSASEGQAPGSSSGGGDGDSSGGDSAPVIDQAPDQGSPGGNISEPED